jgi:transposase-like protein
MDWPKDPIELQDDFRPPFCPWKECPEHRRTEPGYRFAKSSSYSTRQQVGIPRFRCSTCRRRFSRQTFSTTYYLKRRDLLIPVAAGIVAGSAHRQIARSLECAPTTVTRLAQRLGRHAILLQARAVEALRGKVTEPFVLDHFETFEFTQDFPFGVATPVGAESWFVYGVDPAPHARTGKRTASQRLRIARRPVRDRHGCYVGSTLRTLELLRKLVDPRQRIVIRGDAHPAYAIAVRRHPDRSRFQASWFRNPKRGPKGSPRSAEAFARDDAMWVVDQLHKLVRHTGAHERRETIAFSRRLNAAMERFFLKVVWRNFVKRRSERKPAPVSPASWLGITEGPWRWARALAQRLFPCRETLPPVWAELYRRTWINPILETNTLHDKVNAY